MPKRKKIYSEVKEQIGENCDIEILNAAYNEWKEDESKSLLGLYDNLLGKDNSAKPEVEEKANAIAIESGSCKFDWKKYLEENPEFFALNKEMAKKYGKIDSEKITKKKEREILETVDDKFKIVLLQLFKDIAHMQGFRGITYSPTGPSHEGYCGLVCSIDWGNMVTSGVGDAHYNNTYTFTKHYCGPMAENRSFVRAVKSFFNIPYLGADEIGETPKEEESEKPEAPTGPHVTLKKICKEKLKVVSFDGFKEYLRKQVKDNPDNPWVETSEYSEWAEYADWEQIPKRKIAQLISKIKEYK